MKTITIEIREGDEPGSPFDVVTEDGRRCDGLAWDEMLRQVVALTHPGIEDRVKHGYRMQTAEQWRAERAERANRFIAD